MTVMAGNYNINPEQMASIQQEYERIKGETAQRRGVQPMQRPMMPPQGRALGQQPGFVPPGQQNRPFDIRSPSLEGRPAEEMPMERVSPFTQRPQQVFSRPSVAAAPVGRGGQSGFNPTRQRFGY